MPVWYKSLILIVRTIMNSGKLLYLVQSPGYETLFVLVVCNFQLIFSYNIVSLGKPSGNLELVSVSCLILLIWSALLFYSSEMKDVAFSHHSMFILCCMHKCMWLVYFPIFKIICMYFGCINNNNKKVTVSVEYHFCITPYEQRSRFLATDFHISSSYYEERRDAYFSFHFCIQC